MTEPSPHKPASVPPKMRRLFRVRVSLLAIALIANIVLLAQIVDAVPGVILFAGSVVLYAVLTIFFWKCPHCRQYPGNAVMPDLCEKCGTVIFGVDAHVPDLEPEALRTHIRLRYILLARTLYGLTLLAYFVVFASVQTASPIGFWAGAITLIALGAWLEWRWWRCPSCGGYMRRSLWPGKTCTKCGEPFPY